MPKIKLKLFERISVCMILPISGLLFTTVVLVASLISKETNVSYIAIAISYLSCFGLFGLSLLLCFIIYPKNENILLLENSSFCIRYQKKEKVYSYADVQKAKYIVCKWYQMPLNILLLSNGGTLTLRTADGEKYVFTILYCDYLRLSQKIEIVRG